MHQSETILVTGAAGFIGYHVSKQLCQLGRVVIGVDNINSYYDPSLKKARIKQLKIYEHFHFYKMDICNYKKLSHLVKKYKITKICHLAGQPGVHYSITNPFEFQISNNEGFLSVIEVARNNRIGNFVYASSSSVYGSMPKDPSIETERVDEPVSLYAATKRSNELVAYCYSHLYGLNCSGLRFFTVYGPWGRPDMALFIFTKAILKGEPIEVYNHGKMKRNFTYIDDIVDGVILALLNPLPCEIYNIGNSKSEELMNFITEIEKSCNKKAIINYKSMQLGDVFETVANIEKLSKLGYYPRVNIDVGIKQFVEWYKKYYKIF
jgi:UDP-glucuronate 4-epimerase